ncbi:hypothetical protein TUM20985_28760 [Mycobacterium antarcticum]|nr:hypothetical protein TUM20985_28760 [Mycolicibacterium sp. TUM20985]GLP84125.1 hypothetical protein TUM20984_55450 [Mycolicibacterium sp. TUM20984]
MIYFLVDVSRDPLNPGEFVTRRGSGPHGGYVADRLHSDTEPGSDVRGGAAPRDLPVARHDTGPNGMPRA